jgi:hypothetical protein
MHYAYLNAHNILLVIAFILALLAALTVSGGPKAGWSPWSWVFFVAAFLFVLGGCTTTGITPPPYTTVSWHDSRYLVLEPPYTVTVHDYGLNVGDEACRADPVGDSVVLSTC